MLEFIGCDMLLDVTSLERMELVAGRSDTAAIDSAAII